MNRVAAFTLDLEELKLTKTEKKIEKRIRFGGFTSGADLKRALKMLRAIQRARQELETRKAKELV